jgi:hypothetical protein
MRYEEHVLVGTPLILTKDTAAHRNEEQVSQSPSHPLKNQTKQREEKKQKARKRNPSHPSGQLSKSSQVISARLLPVSLTGSKSQQPFLKKRQHSSATTHLKA